MKEPKCMELPREVWMGPRVLEKVADVCQRLHLGKRALVVADPNTHEVAGESVCRSLKKAGIDTEHVTVERADMKMVESVRELVKDKVDFLLGVGGGTSIDVAKSASFQEGKLYISVPTAASHDGIASARSAIKGGKTHTSVEAQPPIAIIADTQIIANAPHRLLAAGCGDMIANYTAVRDWELAHRLTGEPYSEYAAALSQMSAKLVMESAEVIKRGTEESARKVVKALISSGVAMSIAGSSRPASGSEHLFSHALERVAPEPALHGEQCGVGAIMMTDLQGDDWRVIRDALRTIGAPTNAKELGIEPKYIVEALAKAHDINPERYTVLKDGLSEQAAERLAKETEVI